MLVRQMRISHRHVTAFLHDGALEYPASSIDRQQRLINAMGSLGAHRAGIEMTRRVASEAELARVHDRDYLAGLQAIAEQGLEVMVDPEMVIGPRSYPTATAAAGGVIEALELRAGAGKRELPICLSRPGSHHAGPDYALGLCLVNNLAVAAAHALDCGLAERVAVLDFDAHHGNGTEEIFAADPRVLTVSIHQYPFYPGSGGPGPCGVANLNLPLAAGSGHDPAIRAFEEAARAIKSHRADLILLEAGFDGHSDDWTSELSFDYRTYRAFGAGVIELVDSLNAAMVIELGGGYTSTSMGEGLGAFLDGLR